MLFHLLNLKNVIHSGAAWHLFEIKSSQAYGIQNYSVPSSCSVWWEKSRGKGLVIGAVE